ncbi:MAG: hypothetical protein NXY57DRAFT_1051616 [Lentinula lateritia]|nr:MAG: hypothetical protein NXY57DRAFT_1051616 [Lentinula lateritia]
MRGYGNPRLLHEDNKWKFVWRLMKDKRIGILALQETHLTNERVHEINEEYGKQIQVFASHDPTNPTGKGGVAIVLNRRMIHAKNPRTYEIVPGKALLIQIVLHQKDNLSVLVVYAPNVSGNNGSENAAFWEEIKTYFETRPNIPKPDVMLGDCNMVESGMIDRMPAHDDPEEACEALDNIKTLLQLRDGWRLTNPGDKSFSYMQLAMGSQYRIDRIYVTDAIMETAKEWKIRETGVPNADHSLISVQITSEEAPWFGKGRWRIPDYVIRDKDLMAYAREQGIKARKELETLTEQTPTKNAQTTWYSYKMCLVRKAKARATQIVPGLTRKINETQLELDRTLNDAELAENVKIERVELKRAHSRTRHRIETELPSCYMSQINKEKKPRDMIYALRKPGTNEDEHGNVLGNAYEKDSEKMAELAKEYHQDLQQHGIDPMKEPEREEITQKLIQEQKDTLKALKLTKNHSAPAICQQCDKDKGDERKETFDIIELMTEAFNDISIYGITEETHFSDGWMCPIYKKGEKSEISNYRPITLLNTDYKIFTKALTFSLRTSINQLKSMLSSMAVRVNSLK